MIIYFTIFTYVLFFGYLGKRTADMNINIREKKYSNNVNFVYAILIIILPLLLISYGYPNSDKYAYFTYFENLDINDNTFFDDVWESKGPLWLVIQWFIKKYITSSADSFLLIITFFQMFSICKFYYKYSSDYPNSILLFFLSMSFYNMMNGIRQFSALCLIILFCDWLFKKKYVPFLFIVILAYYIHSSAIVWAFAILIIYGEPFNKRMIASALIVALAILFLDQFTSLLENSLSDTLYAGYTNQFNEDDGGNIINTIIYFIPVLLSFIKRKQILAISNSIVNISINCTIIAFLFSVLSLFTSGILIGRLPMYFSLFSFILYPWLFKEVYNDDNTMMIKYLCYIGYTAFAIYYVFSQKLVYNNYVFNLHFE